MADITEKQASQSIKLVGSDLTGTETNYLDVTSEGEIKVASFPNVSYLTGLKTASTTELLVSVGGANLVSRKTLTIYNKGAQDVYFGPTGVTDTTGIPIIKDEAVTMDVGDNVHVYIVTKTGTTSVVIQEYS